MELEQFDPDFQEIYNHYIRQEKQESDTLYREMEPEFRIPEKRISRRWIPAAAATVLLLVAGTWALTSEYGPFRPKPKYTQAEIRESLEKTIHALSSCSKTIREEFSRVGDLTAMTTAIKPAKKSQTGNMQKSDTNTSKN